MATLQRKPSFIDSVKTVARLTRRRKHNAESKPEFHAPTVESTDYLDGPGIGAESSADGHSDGQKPLPNLPGGPEHGKFARSRSHSAAAMLRGPSPYPLPFTNRFDAKSSLDDELLRQRLEGLDVDATVALEVALDVDFNMDVDAQPGSPGLRSPPHPRQPANSPISALPASDCPPRTSSRPLGPSLPSLNIPSPLHLPFMTSPISGSASGAASGFGTGLGSSGLAPRNRSCSPPSTPIASEPATPEPLYSPELPALPSKAEAAVSGQAFFAYIQTTRRTAVQGVTLDTQVKSMYGVVGGEASGSVMSHVSHGSRAHSRAHSDAVDTMSSDAERTGIDSAAAAGAADSPVGLHLFTSSPKVTCVRMPSEMTLTSPLSQRELPPTPAEVEANAEPDAHLHTPVPAPAALEDDPARIRRHTRALLLDQRSDALAELCVDLAIKLSDARALVAAVQAEAASARADAAEAKSSRDRAEAEAEWHRMKAEAEAGRMRSLWHDVNRFEGIVADLQADNRRLRGELRRREYGFASPDEPGPSWPKDSPPGGAIEELP